MLPSQFILSAVIILIVCRTIINLRTVSSNRLFYLLWIFFWTTILYFIFHTKLLSIIANQLKIGRGVDFAVYCSIIAIFYLIYFLMQKIMKLQDQITKIVRQLTLLNITKKHQ